MNVMFLPEVDRISNLSPKPLKIREKEKKIIQPIEDTKLLYKDIAHQFYTEELIELIKYAKNIRKLEKFYGRARWRS
tara:strand:+ start:6260 stop:6490 length:231 start_codon:yes stop_codon:yes gene_type:complete